MIPIIFDNQILTGNGYGRMADAISCTVTHEINGQYELAMDYPVTGQHYDRIEAGMVLFAAPDPVTAEQPFRIYRVTRPLNGVVTVYARHIAYDMSGISVLPFTASSLSEAFSLLPSKCVPSCPFTFATTRSVASRISTSTPMPLWSLLGGVAGSFLDVYGGEWDFNGLTASLPSSLGQDNGVSVRYGKNMTELEQDITVESTWAAVLPFWFNEETGQLVKTEQPVPVQGAFGSRVLTLDLSEEWEEAPTVAQLTARTEQYITANRIGEPQVAWKVNMAMLDQSEEYKGLAILERVQLGDTVTVIYEPYGIDVKARAVMIEYDVLAERYKNITLGRVKQNLAKIVASTPAEITAAVNAAKSALEKAIDSSTDFITHGAGYMRFIYNDDKVLQEIVSLDNPDINQAQSVWRWNNGGFGHSSTGYAGPYTVAMTQDGAIVADFITAGTLSGDRVRTGIITDVSGRNYWNLNTGEWKNVAIETTLENLQEQIDNNIETFTGPAVPTLTNYPANAWTTTEEKDKHIGDLYVVNSQGGDYEGFYYRFEKTGSTYQWRLLKDTEVTKALADAEEALRRVGVAETQIEQNAEAITLRATKTEAQGYANTAQANAISAAASDATTKANAAESAAKSYADAQITISADAITSNVSATYETKTDATGKLNTAKTYAEGQASAAETNAKGYTDGKLTDYSTTAQMNSAISQSAESITSTVSATYETKTDATSKLNTAKTYAETQASAAEEAANDYTDGKLADYSTTAQMESAIEQTASSITSTVSATYETKAAATQKLNTAKSYAETQAADAEAAAISTAAADATTKANAAEAGAKGYTDGKLMDYSTTVQMNSAIEQTASNITSTVSATYETKTDAKSKLNTAKTYAEGQAAAAESNANDYTDGKLTDYSTTTQMESAIEQTAASITSTVSATYETKADATTKLNTAKTYADGKASEAEDAANDYTDGKLTDYSTTVQMNSAIEQTASNITSTVSATYETKTDATSKLNTAKTYADGKAATAESNAKTAAQGYADAAESGAKDYTDGKLTDYSTTVQMNSAINQTASNITSTVSATYETKSDATSKLNTAKTYADGKAATAESNAKTAAQGYADAAEEAANDYTDGKLVDYSTTTQMESAISQSASDITSTVSATYETKAAATQKLNTAKSYAETQAADAEAAAISTAADDATTKANAAEAGAKGYTDNKLTGYSTTTQMNSAISQSAGSILQTVSETYTTKTEFGGLEDDVEAVETRVSSAESTLEVQAGQIASKVSETDYNGNTIASKINQNATTVKINAAKIDLQGAVTISDFDSAAQAALVKNTTTKNQYAQSASSTTAPTSGWQDTIPAYNATNKYIWLRVATTKTFADNTTSTTYSTPVVDVNLTKSIQDAATAQSTATGAATAASTAQTTANNAASAASTAQTTANNAASAASTAQTTANNAATAASTAQSTADAALGTTKSTQQYYLSTSSTSATGGTWQDTVPTWSSGKYVWTRIKTDATTKSGTALSPVYSTAVYDANLTTALSTASSASSAASAAQSTADGAVTAAGTAQTTANNAASAASAAQTTANGAVKSSSVKTQYYLSTSASSATGGSWSDTIPTWADGKYLWTRIATTTTPVSGTASTTYQPSANGAYDKNLTSALSTATAAASTAAAAQTKANAALVTSVSVYFRASTSTVPGKPTAEVTSTAVDTSDAWTLCMPRPKKGTTYYTCEQNKDGNGTVSWTAVQQMANTTYVASWASSANATYIDGANIYTGSVTANQMAANSITAEKLAAGSVTADKIAANEVLTQKLTATDLTITGGKININTGGSSFDVITLTTEELGRSVLSPVGIRFDKYVSGSFTSRVNINYAGAITTYQAGTSNGVAIGSDTPLVTVRNGAYPDIDRTDVSPTSVTVTTGSSGAQRILSHNGLMLYAGTNKYSALVWPDSNGAGRFILGDGTSTKWRTELTNDGLVFRNTSDKVTAKYPNSPTSTNYTPSNTTLTFHSDSVIRVRKLGSGGVYSILMQLNNPGDFATGTYYDILTLPEEHRPWYVVSHIACNGVGSPVYIRVKTDGVVSIYRYAGAAWTNSWIRVEIPVIFANP